MPSDLQEICTQVSAIGKDIVSMAQQLHTESARLRQAAARAAAAARGADGDRQAARAAQALENAAGHCARAASTLIAADSAAKLFVQRNCGGGTATTTAGPVESEGTVRAVPELSELAERAEVRRAVAEAWDDSMVDDPESRHEEGGWIIHDTNSDSVRIVRVASGERGALSPGAKPSLGADEHLAGFFHTHPNAELDEFGSEWHQGPSLADRRWHEAEGVPGIVRNRAGEVLFGPGAE